MEWNHSAVLVKKVVESGGWGRKQRVANNMGRNMVARAGWTSLTTAEMRGELRKMGSKRID